MPDEKVVHVEVHGQRYPIKTTLEPGYVQELANYVHRKMGMAADVSPSTDMLGLAILAALNLADELFRIRNHQLNEAGSLAERAQQLERIVDEALELVGHSQDDLRLR
jgi:cell division protein ZapA